MKQYLCTILFLLPFLCFSQEVKEKHATSDSAISAETPKDSVIEDSVTLGILIEEKAEFPGGEAALNKFIYKNIKYPSMARELNVQGRVFISFVVEKDGSITDVKPIKRKSEQLGYGLEEEAMRVIKLMPKWKPATQNGKKVKMRFTLPVLYRLN